jgi:hypothetical protein
MYHFMHQILLFPMKLQFCNPNTIRALKCSRVFTIPFFFLSFSLFPPKIPSEMVGKPVPVSRFLPVSPPCVPFQVRQNPCHNLRSLRRPGIHLGILTRQSIRRQERKGASFERRRWRRICALCGRGARC